MRLLVCLKRCEEIIRCDEFLFRFGACGFFDSCLVKFDGFLEVTGKNFVAGQIGHARDATELSHRIFPDRAIAENQSAVPKVEGAMVLERRHPAQISMVYEMWHVPLYRLNHIGARRMNELSDVFENRPGEIGGPGNVVIHARVEL
jgi:hypothetical protein